MKQESLYIKEIRELIAKKNSFGIIEIRNLDFLKGLNFGKEDYPSIVALLKEKKIDEVMQLQNVTPKTFEDLSILRFHDQNNEMYVVLVYDSDELWQDPEILEIFHL